MKEFFVLVLVTTSVTAYASCDSDFQAMTRYLEKAQTASAQGDACATADALEIAINYADDAYESCTGSQKTMVEQLLPQMTSQMFTAIDYCGH